MDVVTCPACGDSGLRDLPTRDGMETYPCPCCQPSGWPRGFPGEYVLRGGRRIWIVEPSDPGVPARYVGWSRTAAETS